MWNTVRIQVSQVALNSWLPLCRTSDLMYNVHNVEVFSKSVDVAKNLRTSTYEVFDDKCPHRGAKLSCGILDVNKGSIRCPYHGMKFDLEDGTCTGFLGDYDPTKTKAKLHKHESHLFDSLVWSYLGEGEPPEFVADKLQEFVADREEDFSSIYGQRDIDCNMFEVEENLLDICHINFVHSWGNPESLPTNTIKSPRGSFFFYKYGKNSLAKWLDNNGKDYVDVYNGFAEPLSTLSRVGFSTLSRVGFGSNFTKSVRVHLLPLDENKTRMFWGLHRNFMKASWMDVVFRFLMERTIDEDKAILENMASRDKQMLTEFDWVIVQYRKYLASHFGKYDK